MRGENEMKWNTFVDQSFLSKLEENIFSEESHKISNIFDEFPVKTQTILIELFFLQSKAIYPVSGKYILFGRERKIKTEINFYIFVYSFGIQMRTEIKICFIMNQM